MKRWASCALALAVLLGCSEPAADFIAAIGPRPHPLAAPSYRLRAPLRTLPWVADFRLGAALDQSDRVTQLKNEFSPGEPVYLSMRVNDVPHGTVVTTYWYGPSNLTLGYQTQAVAAGQARLSFVRSDTGGWQQGAYRVEVWIGDSRIAGKYFDIVKR